MIRADLGDCQRCKLCKTRDQIVFGVGPALAPIMFIGEAPGAEEDRRGVPFVGPAGELLDKMIEAMGWGRDDVYIANVRQVSAAREPQPRARRGRRVSAVPRRADRRRCGRASS
jgi:uracil-DNA glycosylase family 4